MNRIMKIRAGGDVKRFHTVTMLREHLVSSHSWGVATLLLDIDPNISKELLVAALYHDVAESVTGDVPATTKWRYPAIAELLNNAELEVETDLGIRSDLRQQEKDTLKFADMLDLVLACVEEFNLGNRGAGVVALRGLSYLKEREWPAACSKYLENIEPYVMMEISK